MQPLVVDADDGDDGGHVMVVMAMITGVMMMGVMMMAMVMIIMCKPWPWCSLMLKRHSKIVVLPFLWYM